MLSPVDSILPRRPRGRLSASAEIKYREKVIAFCALILQIRSTMDFSTRWCQTASAYLHCWLRSQRDTRTGTCTETC
jgi:hypothetical protein